MHGESERQDALDRDWMHAVARAEERQRFLARLQAELAKHERGEELEITDLGYLQERIPQLQEEVAQSQKGLESMERGGIFNADDEGYTLAREAIAWLEEITKEWSEGGSSPAEHVLRNVEQGDNPVHDEELLREMENSAMVRVEATWRAGVPQHLRQRFVDALRAYAVIGDHGGLIKQADEIARRIELEPRLHKSPGSS